MRIFACVAVLTISSTRGNTMANLVSKLPCGRLGGDGLLVRVRAIVDYSWGDASTGASFGARLGGEAARWPFAENPE